MTAEFNQKTSADRIESDSIGELAVPADAYYGVQSLRAKHNFPITGRRMHPSFIRNLALVKQAAAMTNHNAGRLSSEKTDAILQACREIADGRFADEFIVDPVQGGAGTSANMNINEVIANRAGELLGGKKGSYDKVHPNDDVNMAQSTNDVIPTAGRLTVLDLLKPLLAELDRLIQTLDQKAVEFDDVLKMGRTQLEDAVPMRLGQTFGSYSSMVKRAANRIRLISEEMYCVNLGGTAIGTAINVSAAYLTHIVPNLAKLTGYPLYQARDLFDATEHPDSFSAVSGALKACAIGLSKMSNDLRLLSSGPKTGFAEIVLPAMQNGSSIMPGKINPVIPEVVSQAAFLVIGHDVTITMAAEGGQMELNAFEPVLFSCLFESITALTGAISTLTDNCISGIRANRERCLKLMESSAGIATALCPYLGYRKSAEIAKASVATGKTVRSLVLEQGLMNEAELNRLLDAYSMTEATVSK